MAHMGDATPSRQTTDRRVARSRQRVLEAAHELLAQTGVSGFSVDEVARRSGVAKTTVYRHWASREALVLDAASRISAEYDVPDSGNIQADVAAFLSTLGRLLGSARWSSVVPSIIDVAERDSGFADIHSAIQRGHAAPLRRALNCAVQRGDLPAGTDVADATSALIGPLYYRRWFSREPIDADFVAYVVHNVLG